MADGAAVTPQRPGWRRCRINGDKLALGPKAVIVNSRTEHMMARSRREADYSLCRNSLNRLLNSCCRVNPPIERFTV